MSKREMSREQKQIMKDNAILLSRKIFGTTDVYTLGQSIFISVMQEHFNLENANAKKLYNLIERLSTTDNGLFDRYLAKFDEMEQEMKDAILGIVEEEDN